MCNDTVRTEGKEGGRKARERRHRVGLASAAVESFFKWRGGWKAKRGTGRGDDGSLKGSQGRGPREAGMWAKISA